jgi:hypothetical protein
LGVCNPSPWEAEAGGPQLQPGLHIEALSKKKKKKAGKLKKIQSSR